MLRADLRCRSPGFDFDATAGLALHVDIIGGTLVPELTSQLLLRKQLTSIAEIEHSTACQ